MWPGKATLREAIPHVMRYVGNQQLCLEYARGRSELDGRASIPSGVLQVHPEFYKVAVSAAGCHDNRMDKIWWNEQWNVDPSSTFQVVNALIKANKMFDLLVIPGAGHTSGGPYGDKKRNDFFVHQLLGIEPPDRNVSRLAVSCRSLNACGINARLAHTSHVVHFVRRIPPTVRLQPQIDVSTQTLAHRPHRELCTVVRRCLSRATDSAVPSSAGNA